MRKKKKPVAIKNPMAHALSDSRYRKRVVVSKKVYSRKAVSSKARPFESVAA